jgi:hypothetical protein
MSREWKPGDVAMVKGGEREWMAVRVEGRCLLGCAAGYDSTPHWHAGGGAMADGHDARPLVVIDPESEADVQRFATCVEAIDAPIGYRLQAALREYVNPTPPKCGAAIAFGIHGTTYGCRQPEGHDGPHADVNCTWSVPS